MIFFTFLISHMINPFVHICIWNFECGMHTHSVTNCLGKSRICGSDIWATASSSLYWFKLCWCHVPLQQHSASYSKSDRLWKASGTSQADQTTSPVSDQMSLLGRVQMVPASSEGKVRVTQWVKLDPSWNWLRLQVCAAPPRSSAGIISIKAHAGWTRDYNGV